MFRRRPGEDAHDSGLLTNDQSATPADNPCTAPLSTAATARPVKIRLIVEHVDRARHQGARNAAIILLGYGQHLRHASIGAAALNRANVDLKVGDVLLSGRRPKADPVRRGPGGRRCARATASTEPIAASTPGSVSAATAAVRCSPACATRPTP